MVQDEGVKFERGAPPSVTKGARPRDPTIPPPPRYGQYRRDASTLGESHVTLLAAPAIARSATTSPHYPRRTAHSRFASAAASIASPIFALPPATNASPAPRISSTALFCPSLRFPTSRVISICSPTIDCSIVSM